MVCNRSSDKLCIDLVLGLDMFLCYIRYHGHQTQVKGQTRPKWTTAMLTRPTGLRQNNRNPVYHFQNNDTFTHPSRTLQRNAHNTLAYRIMAALSRRRVKPHASHFAGSIVFTVPQNRWIILRLILPLLATPHLNGWGKQRSGVLLGSSRFASAP